MSRRMAARDGVMVSQMEKLRNYVFSGETLIIRLGILGDDCRGLQYLMKKGNAGCLEGQLEPPHD